MMDDSWRRWIHDALNSRSDDVFVSSLKEQVRTGYRIVRVTVESSDFVAIPVYVVILAHGSELHAVRIPHSPSFLRWCFQHRVRTETTEQEAWRFDAIITEALAPLSRQWGRDLFQSVLIEWLRVVSAPRTHDFLVAMKAVAVVDSGARWTATQTLDGILTNLALRLREDLGYEESEVADILDAAIARSASRHFAYRYDRRDQGSD
ncbi:MAG: hypothetical protein ACHREM_14195 [Polyangiales bacterium]